MDHHGQDFDPRGSHEHRGNLSVLARYPMRRLRHVKIEHLIDRLQDTWEKGEPDGEVLWEIAWRASIREVPLVPQETMWYTITTEIIDLIATDPALGEYASTVWAGAGDRSARGLLGRWMAGDGGR